MRKPPAKRDPIEKIAEWYFDSWTEFDKRLSMPFFPADWITDPHVDGMSGDEVKLYMELLCRAWLGPVQPSRLAAASRKVRSRFVELPDGTFQNPRIMRELAYLEGERWRNAQRKNGQPAVGRRLTGG